MKRSLSGLDIITVSGELQVLVGSRIDKIYQPERDEIAISTSSKSSGKMRLHVALSGWIWISASQSDMPTTPSNFAMQLRKHLSNGIISAVNQHGLDRIIEISVQKQEEYRLIFEIFGDGNVVLVSGDKIIAALRIKKWKHREIRANSSYAYPPEAFDPRNASDEKLNDLILTSKADMVRTLATRLNLGGGYAEEICLRAKIDKGINANELGEEELDRIREEIHRLIGDFETGSFFHISTEDDKPVDISPIELRLDDRRQTNKFSSFSEAIENYYHSTPKMEPGEAKLNDEKERLERTLSSQEEAVQRFREEIDRAQKLAEHIFSNFGLTSALLDKVKASVEEGTPFKEFEMIDPAEGVFSAEISGEVMNLSWRKDVTQNAQFYYEEAKKLRDKLEGALEAIVETKKKLENLEDRELVLRTEEKEKDRRTKPDWFEKYRWFRSSEGVLILAGRDAKSNELLVKKHLKPGDRYVHADIHGAPSVVVKSKEGQTEATLREAGEFSLAMSKAWNAGLAGGSAYWVTPEQVSKTPESGEFVPRGGFIIRGKRNYMEKLELRLGIGICSIESKRKVMCGPLPAVAKHCSSYVEIRPGDVSKEKASKLLAARFSAAISDIQAVLPPGSVDIMEKD